MSPARLNILLVTPLPPSPPRFGAQARIHGLMTRLARDHEISAVSLLDEEFDAESCRRAMREYCREVHLVPNPNGKGGTAKRLLQLRSLASVRSFERQRCTVPLVQETLDRVMLGTRFDVVNLEFPYQAHYQLRQAPPGAPSPVVVLDAHDIAHDLLRQMARNPSSWARRLYAEVNWRKLRRDELAAFRLADGVYTCSAADQARLLASVSSARTAVIPNAADADFFQPRPSDPPCDGRTVVFFGLLSTVPNVDAVQFFVREVWPRIVRARPDARFKIIGAHPPPSLQALAGPRVEITGLVEDLRPHLAAAAVLVVPLRLGSGTRLKIVEGMAMARPIVSTTLGAEGIEVVPGRDLLVADDPTGFAAAVVRLLEDSRLAERLGRAGRQLAVERYSWNAAGRDLAAFYREILATRDTRGNT
jgi:polysaccharide biosynthesis protein PslH